MLSSPWDPSPAALWRPMPPVARRPGSRLGMIAAAQTRELKHVEFEGATKGVPRVCGFCLKEGEFKLSHCHPRNFQLEQTENKWVGCA